MTWDIIRLVGAPLIILAFIVVYDRGKMDKKVFLGFLCLLLSQLFMVMPVKDSLPLVITNTAIMAVFFIYGLVIWLPLFWDMIRNPKIGQG